MHLRFEPEGITFTESIYLGQYSLPFTWAPGPVRYGSIQSSHSG
jgi:hypothetical protein